MYGYVKQFIFALIIAAFLIFVSLFNFFSLVFSFWRCSSSYSWYRESMTTVILFEMLFIPLLSKASACTWSTHDSAPRMSYAPWIAPRFFLLLCWQTWLLFTWLSSQPWPCFYHGVMASQLSWPFFFPFSICLSSEVCMFPERKRCKQWNKRDAGQGFGLVGGE